MSKYLIDGMYHCSCQSEVQFPENTSWDDVEDYYIKYDQLVVKFLGEEEMQSFQLNFSEAAVIDYKRPISASIHLIEDDEVDWDKDFSDVVINNE